MFLKKHPPHTDICGEWKKRSEQMEVPSWGILHFITISLRIEKQHFIINIIKFFDKTTNWKYKVKGTAITWIINKVRTWPGMDVCKISLVFCNKRIIPPGPSERIQALRHKSGFIFQTLKLNPSLSLTFLLAVFLKIRYAYPRFTFKILGQNSHQTRASCSVSCTNILRLTAAVKIVNVETCRPFKMITVIHLQGCSEHQCAV